MKKRGQFYLIAAIIIVVMIITLSSVTNYVVTKKEPLNFVYLVEDIDEESYRVIENTLVNEGDIQNIIQDFIEQYLIDYKEEKVEGTEIVFIYGDTNNMIIDTYTINSTGEIKIEQGGQIITTIQGKGKIVKASENISNLSVDGVITVRIGENDYDFNLNSGQNFFFIVVKEEGDEQYVGQN